MSLESIVKTHEFFTSDSREASDLGIFVALKGETRDGHDFVEDILARFPRAAVVVARGSLRGGWEKKSNVLVVDDTQAAHRTIAQLFREKYSPRVIAVGGSSGKTSTKEFLKVLLQGHFRIIATQKSQNGELGIPKTFEALRKDTEVALIEVGIDQPGDMERHAALVQPDVAVLTSIGEEHLLYLKDVANVFNEEKKLFESCWDRHGTCFAPEADAYLKALKGHDALKLTPERPENVDPSFRSELTHPYALRNAALAASVALHLGVTASSIATKILALEVPEGRGRSWINSRGQTVVADHYNSNPASLRAGLIFAKSFADRGEAVNLILGDMLELGTQSLRYHMEVLAEVMALGARRLILVGPQFSEAAKKMGAGEAQCFASSEEAASTLGSDELRALKGVVMFKGSRGMKLEKLMDLL
ncbi:MAG: UDP-N-acetylmuramoyl-tripeptide--D-alanyl-D-alanine ligase [Bdellovibrionota bacterium]